MSRVDGQTGAHDACTSPKRQRAGHPPQKGTGTSLADVFDPRQRVGLGASPLFRRTPGAPGSYRGALLLEVVVALAVLVAAMGLLGAELVAGLETTRQSEQQLRAALLADRILALVELDPNIQRRITETPDNQELVDAFGQEYPGYFWGITNAPVDQEHQDLRLITIRVLHQPDPEHLDSSDGAVAVRQVGFLKAPPGKIDLVQEAGLSEELAEQLRQTIPIAGFDPHAVDLHQLVAIDPQALLELLPMLSTLLGQAGGSGLAGLMGQLGQEGANPEMPGGLAADELANAIREAAAGGAGKLPGGGGGQPGAAGGAGPGAGSGIRPSPGTKTPGGAAGTPPPRPTPGQPPATPGGPPKPDPQVHIGQGSGPNGEYTIEDLIRMRDEYERSQQGGR